VLYSSEENWAPCDGPGCRAKVALSPALKVKRKAGKRILCMVCGDTNGTRRRSNWGRV
jgi:hypothetical protein